LEAGMVNYELCIMYKVHRRNESSKSWRSRYTPRWKHFLTDRPLKTWESTRVDRLTAISQLGHERAGLSAPHTLPSSQRDLVNMRASTKPKSRLEADLSPSRASTTRRNVALDAQNSYTTANLNRGGGRTEEKRDRINQQQIDRSRNSNRTQACGTEITAGTASAYGWTTFPAERQVAAIKMRVGQNGGPLPFEASFEFGEPFVYFLYFLHGLQEGRFLQQRRAFIATKLGLRRTRVTIPGVSCNSLHAKGHGGGGGRDVRRCREGLRLGRAVRREDEVKPASALLFRAERLGAEEAQVEAEGDVMTLPAEEPRTATTL
jgi:hypothetical protein